VTQILDFLEEHGHLSPEERRAVPATSFKRLISTPEVRDKLGISIANGEFKLHASKAAVGKAVGHVAKDLARGTTKTEKIYTKDDRTILNDTDWLCGRIESAKVTIPAWRRHRAIYERRDKAGLADLGFSALFLNRTNRSGIIGGGIIGGKEQAGKWSLDVRFNKATLIERIRKIARYRDRIKLSRLDGREFTTQVVCKLQGNTFVFFDPPYIERSRKLYFNKSTIDDHRALAGHVLAGLFGPSLFGP